MTLGTLARPSRPMLEDFQRRPTSAISERQLELGYRRQEIDRRPCGCGVDIVLYADQDLAGVVGAHNASPRHEAWAIAAGWR